MTEKEIDEHVENILFFYHHNNATEDKAKKVIKRYLKNTIVAQLEHCEQWIKQFKEREGL